MLLLQTFQSFYFLSFILFHLFTHFSSLETSVINKKLEHNVQSGLNLQMSSILRKYDLQ